MDKKVLIMIVIAIMILVVVGGILVINNTNKNIQIDIDELAAKIMETGAFTDDLAKIDSEMIKDDYGFTNEEIKEIVSYQGSGATSEEIVILQVKDKSQINDVKSKIDTRLAERKEAFESYLPEEVGKIDNNILKVEGNYVILCIANDTNTVNNVLNENIK